MEPSGVVPSDWETCVVLAGMTNCGTGGGGSRSRWAWLSRSLKRAATDERLFGSLGGAFAKVKREGVVGRVGESVDWGLGESTIGPEDEAGFDLWIVSLRGVREEGEGLAEVADDVDVCEEDGGQRQGGKEERGTGPSAIWVVVVRAVGRLRLSVYVYVCVCVDMVV